MIPRLIHIKSRGRMIEGILIPTCMQVIQQYHLEDKHMYALLYIPW